MSFLPIDPFVFVPDETKKQITDGILSKLAKLTEKVPRASQTFQALKSDAALQKQIDQGIQRATQRFVREYIEIDEDLVAAIANQQDFWQSQSIRAALLEIIQNPATYLESEQNTVIQSFSDVLADRVNRERVDKAVSFYLRCVAEALWHLEPFRPVYEMQMQRLNAEAATTTIQAMRGMQAEFQQAILALVGTIGEQQKLLTDGSIASVPEQPKVAHNLPQREYGIFIGREAELEKVLAVLKPYPRSQHAVISIDGIGGIGKSTLALEVAHRFLDEFAMLPTEDRFDAIIWTSAKERVLTADGIKRRHQTHRTLDDIYAAIAITLQHEEITKNARERQADLVRSTLVQQRTLLIVDNLETIDDEAVLNFIRELPAPTKAMITTRHRIDVAYTVRLTGMPWPDAQSLIQYECQKRGVVLTPDQIERLYTRTGGVPLAIVWSVARIGSGYPIHTVLARLSEPHTDIIRFCFEELLTDLAGKPAEKLLIALSYFTGTASRDALGQITNLPTLDRDEGLVHLEKLSLVNKQGNRFVLMPVTQIFAASLAGQDKDIFIQYGKRWLRYLESLYSSKEEYTAEYRLKYGRYLAPEDGPNLLDAVDWAHEHGTATDFFAMTIIAADYLDSIGHWTKIPDLLSRGIELALTVQNLRAAARMEHSLAWLFEQQGNFDRAQQIFEDAATHYSAGRDEESKAATLQRYSAVFRKQKKFEESRKILDQARTIAQRLKLGDLEALLDTEEGKHQRDLGNWDEAWAYFSKVRDYFAQRTEETPRDDQLAIGTWGHLAIVAYHLGRPQEAKDLCLRSLEFFNQSGTKGYMATLNYRMALAEEALGETNAALKHVNEALYWFEQLGMKPDIPAAELLKERLLENRS